MTHITLVRHGQTDWNLAMRIQGSSDIPLNETGLADARRAAETLAAARHHAVYASPLVRAHRTAQVIAGHLGLGEPDIVPGLRERAFGEAEGIHVREYLDRYGHWHAVVPGAETMEQVRDRALLALDAIVRASRHRSAPAAESLIVVTHGGLIRALLDHASGGTLPGPQGRLLNGSVHRFVAEPGALRLLAAEVETAAA